ncbi:hypothetical protein V8D89_001144 [Ganoderma adspersum]
MAVSFTALAGWHDALHEILNHLELLDDYEDDDEGEAYFAASKAFKSTLFSLALSSHALSDPSLNKLWGSLSSISPFLRLLPNYQRHDLTSRLTGDISPEAWSRLQTYASRVRSVSVFYDHNIHPSVWEALYERCDGLPLFPNLAYLSMTIWNPAHAVSSIRILATPSLRTVFLSFQGQPGSLQIPTATAIPAVSAATASILQELFVKSPNLNRLFVRHNVSVDRQHLMDLSRFTQMEVLDINHHSPLVVRGPHAHLARFILASSMPLLNHLCLGVGAHPIYGFDASLVSICRHIGPYTLTLFRAELGRFGHLLPSFMTLLAPILPFAKLEQVEFFFDDHTPLLDDYLDRIARAWPKLRTLIFMQSNDTMFDPDRDPGSLDRPTLRGLVELARGCPKLERLCIPDLDATSVPPADDVPLMGHGPLNLCIQNLVGAQEEERQLEVAVVLDRLFPRLKLKSGIHELPGLGFNENRYLEESKNIATLLRAIQAARKHYPGGL